MRIGHVSATLAVIGSVSAQVLPDRMTEEFKASLMCPEPGSFLESLLGSVTKPLEEMVDELKHGVLNGKSLALDLQAYKTKYSHPGIPIEQARETLANYNYTCDTNETKPIAQADVKIGKRQSVQRCSNPRIRVEWDRMNDSDRQAYIDALKCLMSKPPSGQFPPSKSRYEDFTRLHQIATPNVHNNPKFGLWHRGVSVLMENTLRTECNWNGPMPWFDEPRYAGRFSQSSMFSPKWFGSIGIGGRCLQDGQFAGLICNIGPGDYQSTRCLQRDGQASITRSCNQEYQDMCLNYPDWAGMSNCIMGGIHAFGHNGMGGGMADVSSSPCEPWFWTHHAYIDRLFRLWTNRNPQWLNQINGNDAWGNPLTMDTKINFMGMMPDLTVREALDTLSERLCYRYDY